MQGEETSPDAYKRILDELSHITTLIITGDNSQDIPGESFLWSLFYRINQKNNITNRDIGSRV